MQTLIDNKRLAGHMLLDYIRENPIEFCEYKLLTQSMVNKYLRYIESDICIICKLLARNPTLLKGCIKEFPFVLKNLCCAQNIIENYPKFFSELIYTDFYEDNFDVIFEPYKYKEIPDEIFNYCDFDQRFLNYKCKHIFRKSSSQQHNGYFGKCNFQVYLKNNKLDQYNFYLLSTACNCINKICRTENYDTLKYIVQSTARSNTWFQVAILNTKLNWCELQSLYYLYLKSNAYEHYISYDMACCFKNTYKLPLPLIRIIFGYLN